MTFSLLEIEQQASQLKAEDRAKLAEFLLETLQEPAIEAVEQEWAEEISRRVSAYENGETSTFSSDIVFAESRRRPQ